jgi:hypothetical protein
VAQPYKVILRYTYDAEDKARGIHEAVALYRRAMQWLSDNERLPCYIKRYINEPQRDTEGHIVIVLTDRDAATMMKLAVG